MPERPPGRGDPDAGNRSLRLSVGRPVFFALERLVSHFGLSRLAVIGRLVSWADDAVPFVVDHWNRADYEGK
ncbi:hypothetical protein [Caballeronia cordobensis]|uniref:hypothetical protein n=1 Tax=Caballeronia cordobensis TaxID=1353886 RepID=UPI000AC8D0EA|nr:hypothetical protein [Caballeronia cordobensis]